MQNASISMVPCQMKKIILRDFVIFIIKILSTSHTVYIVKITQRLTNNDFYISSIKQMSNIKLKLIDLLKTKRFQLMVFMIYNNRRIKNEKITNGKKD